MSDAVRCEYCAEYSSAGSGHSCLQMQHAQDIQDLLMAHKERERWEKRVMYLEGVLAQIRELIEGKTR